MEGQGGEEAQGVADQKKQKQISFIKSGFSKGQNSRFYFFTIAPCM
jgi:hypothetical protein